MRFVRTSGLSGAWSAACLAVLFACAAPPAIAQPVVPPAAIQQFNDTIGSRVEAGTVVGGDYGAAGGIYTFRGGTLASLSVTKIAGGGAVTSPQPLGDSGMKWAPVLLGNLALFSTKNTFENGYLQGNEMSYDMKSVQGGGGARFYFTDNLSLTPTVSGIYGRVENEFNPKNVVGDQIKSLASGTFVDWTIETWTITSGLEGIYDWNWGRARLEFASRYTYFHTESFHSSSPVIDINGDSHTWENKLDADVPLGLNLFGRELHTGGFVSRTELFGGVSDGLNESRVYTANARLVLDMLGTPVKLRWIGLGASYFWGDHVNGWTGGIDLRFQF